MIPLLVEFSKKTVVIFGGGDVGARKAAYFAPEAKVHVYSRSFSPAFSGLDVEKELIDLHGAGDERLPSLLKGAFLAVAATPDRELNNRIGELCQERGILFNNAEGISGDLLIPSVVKGERFLLAVSTGGSSPAISRFLREFLEKSLPDLDRMIALQERLRAYLKECQPDTEARKDVLWKVLMDREVWRALHAGETAAWSLIARRYLQ
ncbi:MAG TPA: bifunctional precorrin-2 dehydrogenase/sirohydrochlorin ferrochelatase [Methanolinea sp.]|nr:bifunctional precorrin-2 dehydrogenase/sirohydrochlorin ferrochelatase [Methanolinea sp.]HQK55268.1 bifunctional precorrin-2 dehydrogenase/sirohydrochlorin ferrochelatase [Methanolinea sp.]